MRDSLGAREICVIDISTRGMLATAARPPKRGDFIELTIGLNKLAGQVAWASERRFGVSLRERVSVAAVAEGGLRKVELECSVGMVRRRTGMLAALVADPQALGRIGQFACFVLVAAVVGWVIVGYFGETMAPVQAAVAHMN
jgi:hypothetical protein